MSIADKLRQKFQDRLTGEMESYQPDWLDGETIYWKPLTGAQQKAIQKAGEDSVVQGICMHIKTRALDDQGNLIFGDTALIGLMNDFDFQRHIIPIFNAMTDGDLGHDEIEKN